MGIPKFFRWMSERYPGLLEQAKSNQIPQVDNFYLDMNGIIHNCSHPNDNDVQFRISETQMFEDIFNYVDTLFGMIKPKEFFFMAVDGVAPRAKMNQQRGRRFRSAKEASDRENAALAKGDVLPAEQRFDSNCITPGTEFMVKLSLAMNQFVQKKLQTDPKWQHIKVVLSGHEAPGEGEHKIMDFIRYQRSQPGYRADTSHCLYGLDTDLIMLGLSSHEPKFMLLREEVKLTRKNDATKGKSHRVDPTKINFNVLSIEKLRNFIDLDFRPLSSKMKCKFDLEAIIDDWILICFLIGNDFIPHIPHFHIHKGALPKIFEIYKSTLLKQDGYMNVRGVLNLKRFKKFTNALALADFENYLALVKENGGECSTHDFSKLNEFVKHKLRVTGIRQNGNRDSHKSYNRSERPNHHSHFHKPNVWYDLQNQRNHRNQNNRGSSNNGGTNINYNPHASIHTPAKAHAPAAQSTPKTLNGTPNGRTGVHSFTEEEINNSITVCADGDITDLSDEEYLSGEKFPGDTPRPPRGRGRYPNYHQSNNGYNNHYTVHQSNSYNNNNNSYRGEKIVDNNNKYDNKNNSRSNPRNVRTTSREDTKTQEYNFQRYKETYYREKLKIEPDKSSVLKVVHEYVRALQWNLHYYYHGCISWGWYYPYHYAPFISDVAMFENIDTVFDLGEPFKPLEQLLSVLPAASSSLLPKVYRSLVSSESSPLAKYFPTEVEYDLNGKQNDWEAVVLAPFIDQEELLKASLLYNFFLTEDERSKNTHGPHMIYYYEKPKPSPGRKLPPNAVGKVRRIDVAPNGFNLPRDKIRYGLINDG